MRKDFDFYPTPDGAIRSLLDNYPIQEYTDKSDSLMRSRVLEPCAGDGAISGALVNRYNVYMKQVEIRPEARKPLGAYGTVVIDDFLTNNYNFDPDYIITNPPYLLAQEFITKCLKYGCPVIMLLRLCFLASMKRNEWWQDKIPGDMLVLSKRPSFTGDGKTDGQDYAWFIWNGLGRGLSIV